MKFFLGIILGALGMGLAQGIAGYFMDTSKTGSGDFTGLSDSKLLGFIVAFVFGAMAGGFIGGFAAGFSFSFPKSVFFSFGLSLFVSFMFFIMAGQLNYSVKYMILCFLVLGTICGTLVSLLNQNR